MAALHALIAAVGMACLAVGAGGAGGALLALACRRIQSREAPGWLLRHVSVCLPVALFGFAMVLATHTRNSTACEVLLLVCINARIVLHRLCRPPDGGRGRADLWLLLPHDLLVVYRLLADSLAHSTERSPTTSLRSRSSW
jgi:hypothetical protein